MNIAKHWHDSFDIITDLVSLHDKDFKIVRANKAFRAAFNKTQESVFGTGCYQLFHKTAAPICNCPLKQSVESGDTAVEEIYEPALGLYLEITCYPLFDDKGEFEGALHFAKDITERKQAADALRRSEMNLSSAQKVAHIGSWHFDIPNNALWWSSEAYRIFGVPDGTSLTLESFFALIHPEDVDYVARSWVAALARQPYDIKHRIVVDGNIKWVNEKAEIMFDENDKPLSGTGTVQDISKFKQTEDALKQSEARYRLLVENIPQKIFLKDRDSVYVSCNANYAGDLKINSSEIAGMTDYDFYPEEMAEKYRADDKRVMEKGTREDIEEKYIQNGNQYFVYTIKTPVRDEQGNVSGIFGIFSDITERKRAEEKIIESEKRYRTLFDQSPDGILLIDTPGNIVEFNEKAHCQLGYSRQEFENLSVADIDPFEGPEKVRERIKTIFKEGKAEFEVRHITKQGELRDVYVITQSIVLSGRNVIFSIWRDITERKQAESALREQQKIMLIQSRHAAMGEMIANIAHQWRQPLNTLGLLIQDIRHAHKYGELDTEYLDRSVKEGMELINHMSGTIDDFRDYFRPDKEKIFFRLEEAVKKTIAFVEASFKNSNIAMELDIREDISIEGYPNEYSQALLNILNNAKDVLIERMVPDPLVTISIFRSGGRSAVTVEDNAGGIPDEIMGKIFDPYFTTREPGQGTGIGLYMSKTIIEKSMGGTLTARNTANGAEFTIEA